MKNKTQFRGLAQRIVENGYHDKESNTLFVTNPGISFDTLKGLAKKYNFTLSQTKTGEYVSVPASQKYSNGDNQFSLYDNFIDSYTLYNKNYDTLLSAYKIFDAMDENLAEVSLMLNTYTSEVLSQGFIDNPLKIKISNKNAQNLIEKILLKNKIYQRLPNIVRSIAKYGNYGMILSYPYLENWMENQDEFDFNKIDILEDLAITFVNPKYFQVGVDEYYNPVNYETQMANVFANTHSKTSVINQKIWQPWQFVHFLMPDEITEPYGKSMLWSMRSAFDQLTTLEAFLAISRASKIQRLVFTVPLPNGTSLVDSYGFMAEFRANYLNSIFTDMGSVKGGRKIPGAMSVLTLPKAHDGEKVEVDHIESQIDLSSVEDVEYFLDKILRNSNLPKGYLVGEDVITTSQTLEAQDLKLKRTLLPLKQAIVTGMMNLVENILAHAGYDVTKLDVEVSINEPIQIPADVIQKYADICELTGAFAELNPEMPDINKFQVLVKMGMPADIASLVCSKSAVNVLANSDELGKFLMGQKVKTGASASMDAGEMEEATSVKITSKQFLQEKTDLGKDLKRFQNLVRGNTDKTLKESILKSQKKAELND